MMSCINVPELRANLIAPSGQIQVIFGPMFSGKTTELMRRMKRFQIANYNCLMVKYAKDNRYDSDGVATHDSQILPATGATELLPLAAVAEPYDVIGIDEGQFFPDVVSFCEKMADCSKTVIVAALDGTFQRKGFGSILDLVPIAESVVKLNAVCMVCYGEAAFTKRKGSELKVEVIGGADKYLAVCRKCYHCPDQDSPCKENIYTPFNQTINKEKSKAGRRLFGVPLSPNKMPLSS